MSNRRTVHLSKKPRAHSLVQRYPFWLLAALNDSEKKTRVVITGEGGRASDGDLAEVESVPVEAVATFGKMKTIHRGKEWEEETLASFFI